MRRERILAFVAVISCWCIAEDRAESKRCCDDGLHILSVTNTCQNGKNVSVDCSGFSPKLSIEWIRPQQYVLESDSKGEYLNVHQKSFVVREPNFCEGILLSENENRTERIAAICSEAKAPSPQYEATAERVVYNSESETKIIEDAIDRLSHLLNLSNLIFSPISMIFFIITAVLYWCIREVRDTEGICIVHIAVNQALLISSSISFHVLSDFRIPLQLQQFPVIATYTWAIALSISTWNRFRKNRTAAKSQVNWHYLFLVYIVPVEYICFHVYICYISDVYGSDFYYRYVFFPETFKPVCFVVSLVLIVLFSILLHKRIRSASLSGETSFLSQARYRLRLFGKLYLLLLVPQIFGYIFATTINNTHSNSVKLSMFCLFLLLSPILNLGGVLLFLLVVVCRPRMRKAIASGCCANCKLLPARWRTEEDPEDEQQNDSIDMLNRKQPLMDYPRQAEM